MKKGFTLIELLAVIVILAIIALIATPIVIRIIDDSKKSSQLQSANFYIDGVELAIANATLENKNISNGTYVILDSGNICLGSIEENACGDELEVEVKGEKPTSGKIVLSNGKIKDYQLTYNEQTIINNDGVSTYAYKESNIEVPDLYNGTLTPVVYDGNNWKIADVTKKWYDYQNQEWANAVILRSDVNKKVGDAVTVDGDNPEVLAMLVWIPRYEYKIEGTYGKGGTSTSLPGEIEVNFINANETKASEGYKIHPAFNFGGTEISGIWVGKFELSHADISYGKINCKNEECEKSDGLRILPNISCLRSDTIISFFYGIRSMSKEGNIFGIDKNLIDTHMMKNNEWGAVAYLSQSRYGKYGNSNYDGPDKEVYINNSSNFYTGRSGGSYGGNTPISSVYQDKQDETQYIGYGFYTYDGYLLGYDSNTRTNERNMNKIASTTGNIYGIYDMSGSAWEYTMGLYANPDGSILSVWFEQQYIQEKYYNLYKQNNVYYGDALNETNSWYMDTSGTVGKIIPISNRGGRFNDGTISGIFASIDGNDRGYSMTTRITLSTNT